MTEASLVQDVDVGLGNLHFRHLDQPPVPKREAMDCAAAPAAGENRSSTESPI
jgi:hypothetical protein